MIWSQVTQYSLWGNKTDLSLLVDASKIDPAALAAPSSAAGEGGWGAGVELYGIGYEIIIGVNYCFSVFGFPLGLLHASLPSIYLMIRRPPA